MSGKRVPRYSKGDVYHHSGSYHPAVENKRSKIITIGVKFIGDVINASDMGTRMIIVRKKGLRTVSSLYTRKELGHKWYDNDTYLLDGGKSSDVLRFRRDI